MTSDHKRALGAATLALCVAGVVGCGSKKPVSQPEPEPLTAEAYTHYMRGRLAAIEGDNEAAAVEFGRAAHAAPNEPEIVVAYIEALTDVGRREDAITVGVRARETWPKRADVAFVVGRAMRKARRLGEAIANLEHARSLDPESDDIALELGSALVAAQKTTRAVAVYTALVKRSPDSSTPRLRLARLLLDGGQPGAAKPVIEELLAKRPAHVKARLLHSRTLRALFDEPGSIKTLRTGFVASGHRSSYMRRVFETLMEAGEHRRAGEFAVALDDPALSPDVRSSVGRLLLRLGKAPQALGLATKIRASDPESLEAALLAADSMARLGRFLEAAAAARSVPLTPYSRIVAAEWLALGGKVAEGSKLAAALGPDDPKRFYIEARILELTSKIGGARAVFASALKKWPDDADLLFEAASFELRMGDAARAVELARPLVSAQAGDAGIQNFFGFALASAGVELDEAGDLLQAALYRHPDDANILDSYGWLLFRRGKLTKAVRTLNRAWRLAPAEPEILFHLAEVETALGRKVAANRRYADALKLAVEPSLRKRIRARLARDADDAK